MLGDAQARPRMSDDDLVLVHRESHAASALVECDTAIATSEIGRAFEKNARKAPEWSRGGSPERCTG